MTEKSENPHGNKTEKGISFYSKDKFPHDPTSTPNEEEDDRQIGDIADVQKLLAEKKERESNEKDKGDQTPP